MKISKLWFPVKPLRPSIQSIQYHYRFYQTQKKKKNQQNIIPPIIAQARLRALQTTYFTPIKQQSTPWKDLDTLLDSLPPISNSGGSGLLRITSSALLEKELLIWRKVTWDIYSALSGPLRHSHIRFQVKVGRIVGHTIRILRILGHFPAAKELDRAFFTRLDSEKLIQINSNIVKADGKDLNDVNSNFGKEEFYFGKGLGLERSKNSIAWMQSLALRLTPGLYNGLNEFGELLSELKKSNPQQVDVYMIAFLLRESEQLLFNSDSSAGQLERSSINQLLYDIKESEKYGKDEVIIKAFAEGELSRRESELPEATYLESIEHEELEGTVKGLIKNLDNGLPLELTDSNQISPSTKIKAIYDQSHTLHLAIRFLILHANSSFFDYNHSNAKKKAVARALNSAISLYECLSKLSSSKVISQNSLHLAHIRQRQSSALFRISWASISTSELNGLGRGDRDWDGDDLENAPILDLSVLESTFDLIDSTMIQRSSIKLPSTFSPPQTSLDLYSTLQLPDPRILGINARFWRHLLTSLSRPSSPTTYNNQHSAFSRTPWSILKRSLSLLLETRTHDLIYSQNSITNPERLFLRSSFLLHLIRACILGGNPPKHTVSRVSSMKDQLNAGEETVRERLSFFFYFIQELERRGERVRRGHVKAAVEEVLKSEFGSTADLTLRNELLRMLIKWFDNASIPTYFSRQFTPPIYPNSIPHLPNLSNSIPSSSIIIQRKPKAVKPELSEIIPIL